MRTIDVTLDQGLTIGNTTHKKAVIREATAGDVIEATEESEKVVKTPDGYELLASNTLVGINVLRRQIVSVGDYKGPLTVGEMKHLSPGDLRLLQIKAEQLESAALEVALRGRLETPGPEHD
jgi:phage FluMu protein gp41